ncbi:MAG TPA: toll/interleukin-1 receptor domain-containing protein [Longimicrobium sp.]|nr:toll/interleukin-1 receptor domain-containing protein [Longimicrobium sp.]
MNIALYTDNTLPLNVKALCEVLNGTLTHLHFVPGHRRLHIEDWVLSNPFSYKGLPSWFKQESEAADLTLIATNIPYDNNFFFHFDDDIGLISFSGWNRLTDLSVINGWVYFIASILSHEIGLQTCHDENTGCLKDFLWDKTAVDAGMRAAFICRSCRNAYSGSPHLLEDLQRLLDLLCAASRSATEVSDMPVLRQPQEKIFDVFLCHNTEDKEILRKINAAMRLSGVVTWFDEEQLEGGQIWQLELERQIDRVQKACVFVGPNGRGPWQEMEIRAFLSEFVRRGCAVIPVLLPGTPDKPDLPIFLREMTWVDLRSDYDNRLARLIRNLKPA